ncbi:hypothetical protein NPIL_364541 [Nephila pilipes]|uniref:Uncharacterized protein n=1 Tax=Nephila pilipes TaxID=299642 RepID=A0A8X6TV07_NEPPI|nr:hypothetical protein NPIL_364541 [Nephila pilipes]
MQPHFSTDRLHEKRLATTIRGSLKNCQPHRKGVLDLEAWKRVFSELRSVEACLRYQRLDGYLSWSAHEIKDALSTK